MWNESQNLELPDTFFSLVVKVKHEKKVTLCRRITKYVNGVTATEGLTQPCEFLGLTFLIAFLSLGSYQNSNAPSF